MTTVDFDKPENDRRKPSPGRRASDFQTCYNHDDTCSRVKALESRMVGWRMFSMVVGGLGAAVIFIAGMTWSINTKVDTLVVQVYNMNLELTKHTVATPK